MDEVGKEKYKSLSGKIICFDGIPGSGKTTLVRSLGSFLQKSGIQVKCFYEPVSEPLLKLYVSDIPKYSFMFQIYMLSRRIDIMEEAVKFPGISLIDRSIEGDYIFAQIQRNSSWMTGKEFDVYTEMARSRTFGAIHAYIKCDSEVAMGRLQTRGKCDKSYSKGYMDKLKQAHDEVFEKCISINHNSDIELSNGTFSEMYCQILVDRLAEHAVSASF